ncbi:MAG: hypothetical protein PHD45_07860 [Bacteroidales bacterium]|nr:hypothetical protein [Bacteroidales bacterium]
MSNIKINNTDIVNYGFIPTKYLESLFTLPNVEEISFVDWHEGQKDADLEGGIPLQREREIEISFVSLQYSNRFITFINNLLAGGEKDFYFSITNETIALRLLEQKNNNLFGSTNASEFSLKFLEERYDRLLTDTHISVGEQDDLLKIDGINVNNYGMTLTKGWGELLSYQDVHKQERGSFSNMKTKAKDIRLEFSCVGLDVSLFIRNYYSFFAMLLFPNLRTLRLNYRGYIFDSKGFYQGMGVNELIIQDGLVWCEFFVNLKAWLV